MENFKIVLCWFIIAHFSVLWSGQIDRVFTESPDSLRQSRWSKIYSQGRFPIERICYKKKEKFLDFNVIETILLFSPDGEFSHADLLFGYEKKQKVSNDLMQLFNTLKSRLAEKLISPWQYTKNILPNGADIDIFIGYNTYYRFYLISRLYQTGNYDAMSIVCLRIESKTKTISTLTDWLSPRNDFPLPPKKYFNGKILQVPMRHQLDSENKGRCVPTTIARQFAFLGCEASQIVIDLVFEQGGEANINRFKTKFKMQSESVKIHNSKEIHKICQDFIQKYNQCASRLQKPVIATKTKNGIIFWSDHFINLDMHIVKQLKLPYLGKAYKDFKRTIIKHIDKNETIGWTVVRHTGRGGHRRLIVGYDNKKDVIYFSDHWGAKKDIEAMPFVGAFLLTRSIQFVTKK